MTLFQSKNANKKINIDETLFPEIASGNKEAFTKLYHLTDKVIYGYIFSILKNPDDAKDIIKEERARRKGRPRKEEGGTKENEQKEQTSNKWF